MSFENVVIHADRGLYIFTEEPFTASWLHCSSLQRFFKCEPCYS